MLELIKIHYKVSKPVEAYKEIKKEAEELIEYIRHGKFRGLYNKAFAISHCQVSETPFAFFVVSDDVLAEKMYPHHVIINPIIIDAPDHMKKRIGEGEPKNFVVVPNMVDYQEACMSFPFRNTKRVTRHNAIRIRYQVPTMFGGLKTIEEDCISIKSEIFQHECEHHAGRNMYFASEQPVKWWELLGTKHPGSFNSLEAFPTDSQPSGERAV